MTDEQRADEVVSQAQINREEWENPDNWSHPQIGVYFSKVDTRVWVPKKTPSWGWTLNLGQPMGFWWLVGLLTLPWLIVSRMGRRR